MTNKKALSIHKKAYARLPLSNWEVDPSRGGVIIQS